LQNARSQGKAALALVWIGSNDLWYLYEFGGDIDDAGDASDAQHFEANIDTILSQLRGTGAQVVIALLDDQSKRPIAMKGEAFVAITPDELSRMSAHVDVYNQIIRDKAAQYGALTVDFYSTDIFTNPETLYYDGNHPNQAGHDIIAQKWFEAIKPILP
jgi:lysophospholipase L1-like esterase